MEFEEGEEEVVTQGDITLESSDIEGMAMEFEHIEEQPMLMESGGEEVISTASESNSLKILCNSPYILKHTSDISDLFFTSTLITWA